MKVVNLTPHAVTILNSTGDAPAFSIPPSGKVARLTTKEEIAGDISYEREEGMYRIQVTQIAFSNVENLPEYDEAADVLYIVSMPVAQALSHRKDVISPNTNRAKRDTNGQIIGVPGFARY